MRLLVLSGLAALSACAPQTGEDAAHSEPVSCALGGAHVFKPVCRVERAEINGTRSLVVHHPDGAFHRLEVSTDGQHLLAADGADTAQSVLKEGRFEVTLGPDRYVIPAEGDGAGR